MLEDSVSAPVIISIHALREESDGGDGTIYQWVDISIHALREESDTSRISRPPRKGYFNPRSP